MSRALFSTSIRQCLSVHTCKEVKLFDNRTSACFDYYYRHFCKRENEKGYTIPEPENPFKRTARILKDDIVDFKNRHLHNIKSTRRFSGTGIPQHCDIVIIGGGIMGSSIAYWLSQRVPGALSVVVVEKDPTVSMKSKQLSYNSGSQFEYAEASTTLSCGGLRQQFSLQENIELSLYGAEFMRNIQKHLSVENCDPPDVQFTPNGYLFLASEKSAEQLEENHRLQVKLGAKNELLSPGKLKERFPWLNTEGVALGCQGLKHEGWFDPWALVSAFKQKALSLGCYYADAEAVGFEFKRHHDLFVDGVEPGTYEGLDKLVIKTSDGEIRTIKFAIAIIAAGAQSGKIARMARIGEGPGLLQIPLPIEPRKRYVYVVHSPNGPGLNCPLTIDPAGLWFRPDGLAGNYLAGQSPQPEDEPPVDNLDVDYEFFDNVVWPQLAARVPCFEELKMKSAWAGFYEYNTIDANCVVGPHPHYTNLYIAAGFSGHGIQHGPAIGRAVMEMIIDGGFNTIDITRLGFDRLLLGIPLREANIV